MIVFEGSRRQRGGNLFSTIKRAIVPLFHRVVKPKLVSTGKDLAKRGITVGVGALRDTAVNKLRGKANAPSLVDNLRSRAASTIDRAVGDYLGKDALLVSQDGSGLCKRKRGKSINKGAKQQKTTRPRKAISRRKDIFD